MKLIMIIMGHGFKLDLTMNNTHRLRSLKWKKVYISVALLDSWVVEKCDWPPVHTGEAAAWSRVQTRSKSHFWQRSHAPPLSRLAREAT